MILAICDGTSDEIYAFGKTEERAKELLWIRVSAYLKHRGAPITSEYNAEELEEFFGVVIVKVKNDETGFLRG